MGRSFHEMILGITGDGDDARRELAATARELRQLDDADAEVDVEVQVAEFRKQIREAKQALADLSQVEATPEITIAKDKAERQINELQAKLAVAAARDYEIDLEVDTDRGAASMRGFLGFVKQIWDGIGGIFAQGAQNAGSSMVGMGGSAGTSGVQLGAMGKVAGSVAAVVGVALVAAIGSAVVALVALTASAVAAAGALGAIGVAFGAVFLPGIALAIGAVQRFKNTADQAGTAANALKTAGQRIGEVFTKTLAPAADAVFRGLARGLNSLVPMIRSLGPEFRQFGQVAGAALQGLLTEFSSPKWQGFFSFLINSAKTVLPIVVSGFISLARILRNIATAAMPFLIAGFKSIAGFLERIAAATADTGQLQRQIGGLVGHLRSWLNLANQLGRVFFGVIKAAAPAGKELVDWLAQGAQKIADWVNSAEGQERIKQFFEDTLPLVKEMVTFFGQLAVILIEAFQAVAPALAFFFHGLNLLLKPVILLLDLFNKIPASVRSWLLPFGNVIATITTIAAVVGDLGGTFNWLKGIVTGVFNGIKSAIQFVIDKFNALPGPVKIAAGAIAALSLGPLGAITAIGAGVSKIVGGLGDIASGAFNAGKDLVSGLLPGGGAVDQVENKFSTLTGTLGTIGLEAGRNMGGKVADGINNAGPTVKSAARQLAVNAKIAAASARDEIANVGLGFGKVLAAGLSATTGDANLAGQKAGAAAKGGIKAGGGGAGQIGKDIGDALGTGLAGTLPDLIAAGINLVVTLKREMERRAKGSPKYATYYLGRGMASQMAEGLTKGIAEVKAAAGDLAMAATAAPAMAGMGGGGARIGGSSTRVDRSVTHNYDVRVDSGALPNQPSAGALVATLEANIKALGG